MVPIKLKELENFSKVAKQRKRKKRNNSAKFKQISPMNPLDTQRDTKLNWLPQIKRKISTENYLTVSTAKPTPS